MVQTQTYDALLQDCISEFNSYEGFKECLRLCDKFVENQQAYKSAATEPGVALLMFQMVMRECKKPADVCAKELFPRAKYLTTQPLFQKIAGGAEIKELVQIFKERPNDVMAFLSKDPSLVQDIYEKGHNYYVAASMSM